MKINRGNSQQSFHSATAGVLIDRFLEDRTPKFCRSATVGWRRSLLENHVRAILPKSEMARPRRWSGELFKVKA